MNAESLAIKRCKMTAKSDEYFNLFFKNIGNFDWHTCLLAFVGNESVITKIIAINPTAQYIIFDDPFIEKIFKLNGFNLTNIKFIDCGKDFTSTIGNLNMKFDKIIMNPPYSKNLHLKVLAKSIERLTENGTCINLSPIRWLQDPLAKYKKNSDYKKFEDSVAKHIINIEHIPPDDTLKLFGVQAEAATRLGIYTCTSNRKEKDTFNLIDKRLILILSKVIKKMPHSFDDYTEFDKKDGWRVRINLIKSAFDHFILHPKYSWVFFNGMQDGKDWTTFVGAKSQFSAKPGDPIKSSIKFATEKEARNFEAACNTDFMHFLHSQMKTDVNFPGPWLPFMSSYEEAWDDKRFFEFFDISEKEQKFIYETVKNLPKYLKK